MPFFQLQRKFVSFYCLFELGKVQRSRLRLEPQFPRLLQAEQQTSATGDGSVQRMDLQNPVHSLGRVTWRRPGRILSFR